MANEPQRPNVNPSPRARFQGIKGAIEAHHSLLENPAFDRALDFATLEFQRLLAEQSRDGNSAMASGFRAMGAIEFVNILKTIAEQATPPRPHQNPDSLPDVEKLKRQ